MQCIVVSDSHVMPQSAAAVGHREGGLTLILLRRLVKRLNRFVQPDALVVLGDLINDPDSPEAPSFYAALRGVFDELDAPWIVIPGNHDTPPRDFYRYMPRPPEHWDVGGVRFLSFLDPEEPGCQARRRDDDIARMANARAGGWRGPVVALQHVPVFPPGACECPYNYTNAPDVLAAMSNHGIGVALSGHYHRGFGPLEHEGMTTIAAPAVCEAPFPYLLLNIDGDALSLERHHLAMPADWGLRDTHVHTPLAYCSDDMDVPLARRLARASGVGEPIFTEHSGHLYFPRQDYPRLCCDEGIAAARAESCRIGTYRQLLDEHGIAMDNRGIELDCGADGMPVVRSEDLSQFPFRIGAVHRLPCLDRPDCSDGEAAQTYLRTLETFLSSGFAVLAHPFRVFARAKRDIPPGIAEPTVDLLREHHTAAEVNVHTNDPDPAWIALCLERGVKLAFGSDAHSLYEVGDFFPHLSLLRQAGYHGTPGDVLFDWPR